MEGVHTTYKFSESSKNSFSKCVMEINVSHLYQEKLNYVNGRAKTFLNPTIILSAIWVMAIFGDKSFYISVLIRHS